MFLDPRRFEATWGRCWFLAAGAGMISTVACAPAVDAGTSAVPGYGSAGRGPRDAGAEPARDAGPDDVFDAGSLDALDVTGPDAQDGAVTDSDAGAASVWQAVGLGSWTGCGLREGVAYCWGANDNGELGIGSYDSDYHLLPLKVVGSVLFSQLSVASGSSCALDREGLAHCWGMDDQGEVGGANALCGDVAPLPCQTVPLAVFTDLRFRQIATSRLQTCGIATDGRTYCWGYPDRTGFRPRPDAAPPFPAVEIPGGPYEIVRPGQESTCALDTSGKAFCWANAFLMNADGGLHAQDPIPVYGDLVFSTISVGAWHACAVTPDGKAYCWGNHINDIVATGTLQNSYMPLEIPIPAGVKLVEIVDATFHVCALSTEGDVYCWGTNRGGALGQIIPDDDGGNHLVPLRVPNLPPIAALASDNLANCAVSTAGHRYCWGANGTGILGDGTTTDRPAPELVP
jgi:alpha-tubulin suppressor-like RCC1 family protein